MVRSRPLSNTSPGHGLFCRLRRRIALLTPARPCSGWLAVDRGSRWEAAGGTAPKRQRPPRPLWPIRQGRPHKWPLRSHSLMSSPMTDRRGSSPASAGKRSHRSLPPARHRPCECEDKAALIERLVDPSLQVERLQVVQQEQVRDGLVIGERADGAAVSRLSQLADSLEDLRNHRPVKVEERLHQLARLVAGGRIGQSLEVVDQAPRGARSGV